MSSTNETKQDITVIVAYCCKMGTGLRFGHLMAVKEDSFPV